MTVSKFTQPDYTTQNATDYKNSLDAGFAVLKRIAQAGAPHEEDPPSDKIKVDAIERYDGGTIKSQSQQTTGSISFPSSNDRIDRVVLDESDLSVSVVTGTEDPSPSVPSIPNGKLPCAQIRLSPSDTEITNDQITDERKAFLFYAVDSASTTDAQNVTQTYKGNDIDSDGDGTVDKADDSDKYGGVDPSDGTQNQFYKTDGTNGSFATIQGNEINLIGTNSGQFNREEGTEKDVGNGSTRTISFNNTYNPNAYQISVAADRADDPTNVIADYNPTTDNNGNIDGVIIGNHSGSGDGDMRWSIFGVVA